MTEAAREAAPTTDPVFPATRFSASNGLEPGVDSGTAQPRNRRLHRVPQGVAGATRRRARHTPEDVKRPSLQTVLWTASFSLLALTLVLLALLLAGETAKLDQLRAQREQLQQTHDKNLQYYAGMRKASKVENIIAKYADEFRVNPSFIAAVIARESHYDAGAQSHKGARGLMQIMEDTGEWIARRLNVTDYDYDRLFEPDLNIRFGTWYLASLSSRFSGSPVMILAAYHAGPGNAERWAFKYAKDRQTLDAGQIPTEGTRDYVRKVLDAYALYHEIDAGT